MKIKLFISLIFYLKVLLNSFLLIVLISILAFSCNDAPLPKTDKEMKPYKEPLVRVNQFLVKKDRLAIVKYIERRNLQMKETESGLWYKIIKSEEADKIVEGSTVIAKYNLSLLDGTICYSTDSLGPERIVVGHTQEAESGLTEGLQLLAEGDKAKFIIPPHLGHGLIGDENKIPPRSILIYDIEILKVQ